VRALSRARRGWVAAVSEVPMSEYQRTRSFSLRCSFADGLCFLRVSCLPGGMASSVSAGVSGQLLLGVFRRGERQAQRAVGPPGACACPPSGTGPAPGRASRQGSPARPLETGAPAAVRGADGVSTARSSRKSGALAGRVGGVRRQREGSGAQRDGDRMGPGACGRA
jgi:hypothetical protein